MKYKIHSKRNQFTDLQVYSHKGGGIGETINKFMDYGKRGVDVGKKVVRFYDSEMGTALRNKFLPQENTGFTGEHHVPLKTNSGWMLASYCGPNTEVVKRVKRGDNGVSLSDKVCKKHDIDYTLATNYEDIKKADDRMINSLKKIKGESQVNLKVLMNAIKAKRLGEKTGLINKNRYSTLSRLSDADRRVLKNNQQELEQQGFGQDYIDEMDDKLKKVERGDSDIEEKNNPSHELKMKAIQQVLSNVKKDNLMKGGGFLSNSILVQKVKNVLVKLLKPLIGDVKAVLDEAFKKVSVMGVVSVITKHILKNSNDTTEGQGILDETALKIGKLIFNIIKKIISNKVKSTKVDVDNIINILGRN